MHEKIIHGSSRGLTFSFSATDNLTIGSPYDYIIDRKERSIRIVSAPNGRYRVSRKKHGMTWAPLIDLRNKEVLEAIAGMEHIRVHISGAEIIISDAEAKASARARVLRFPRVELARLRMAAGIEDIQAAGRLLDGASATLGESLVPSCAPLSIPNIHRDFGDVYTLVSLFSGAGILDWPFFKDPRFSIQYAIDYDAAACETYRHNIATHIVHGDIHQAFTSEGYPLDAMVRDPDVVIGGPSCKPFSNANRHTRLEDHPDSDLVVQYMRIIETLRPRVFAMENVPEALTACGGSYYEAIRETAAKCGYELKAQIVEDDKAGGYTTRKRMVILGSRMGEPVFPPLLSPVPARTVGEALGRIDASWSNLDDVTLPGKDTERRMSFVPQGGNYTSIPEEYRTASKNRHSCTYRRLALDQPSPTLVNWRKPPLIHPTENRTLSVAEAKALHGIPGYFRICGTLGQMQQQVGNSVPVAIGTYIKNAVLSTLESKNVFKLAGTVL